MIDTVQLLIPKELVKFKKKFFEVRDNSELLMSFQNISRLSKKTGLYYPRISNYKSLYGKSANLKLEFSAPKLIFQNNLDECSDDDFNEVIATLQKRLLELSIQIEPKVLSNAKVCNIHYSKNIILANGYTSNYIISELQKIDLRKSLDLASVKYMNDGKSLYLHSTTHEFIIYDKVKETKGIQPDSEILRLEVRLLKTRKIKEVLNKLNLSNTNTFKELFSSKISKVVVNNYWDTLIFSRNKNLFLVEKEPSDILRLIYIHFPKITLNKAMTLLSVHLLSSNGMRELRALVEAKVDTRTWYRLRSDLEDLHKRLSNNMVRDWMQYISSEIKNYKKN